jgi:ABC-2 type transport system ATP-binding protein
MLAEAALTVDEIVIIDRGHLVATGRLEELTRDGRTLEDVFLGLTGAAT